MKLNIEVDTDAGTARVISSETPAATDPLYATQYLDQPWPHLIQIAGLQIMAKAPINPAWKPGMADYIWGRPPSHVADGANGDEFDPPRPLRSPLGFPQAWIKVDGVEIGTVSVFYEGKAFNSDDEILDYMERVNARDAALAKGAGFKEVFDAARRK